MNLTDLSTRHWPSVAAAVALVALFGSTSIASLPIQLLPTIEEIITTGTQLKANPNLATASEGA